MKLQVTTNSAWDNVGELTFEVNDELVKSQRNLLLQVKKKATECAEELDYSFLGMFINREIGDFIGQERPLRTMLKADQFGIKALGYGENDEVFEANWISWELLLK